MRIGGGGFTLASKEDAERALSLYKKIVDLDDALKKLIEFQGSIPVQITGLGSFEFVHNDAKTIKEMIQNQLESKLAKCSANLKALGFE